MVLSQQKVMMCPPDHFGIDYVINPWMEGHRGNTQDGLAQQQWQNLKEALDKHASLTFMKPQPGLPDLVFTANAGMVLHNKVIVSRFKSQERQREEPFFHNWFTSHGYEIVAWPSDVAFEGAGDALLDRSKPLIWAGYGFRSDAEAPGLLEKIYQRRTIGLRLVDPRFYHLDTCFCPLEGGFLLYFPSAFDALSQKRIEQEVAPEKRIALMESDALQFACNAVDLGGHVFFNGASTRLQDQLRQCGFTPVVIALSEFMKAGGAAKCLTLKLYET